MIFPRFLRLLKINFVLIRHGLDELVFMTPWFRPLRFVLYIAPWNWVKKKEALGARIRMACEDLGPIFIKFGQMLSTRPDLLPEDIVNELAKLQDNVPSFPGVQAQQIIEKSLGDTTDNVFKRFDIKPLASASVAQVHSAQLNNGDQVVVKVLRPSVEKIIRRDLSLMHTMARLCEKHLPQSRRLHPVEVIKEYEKTIINELDLMREAASASQLRYNFNNSRMLYIPRVYWDYCSHNVMVMERVYGIPVNDVERLRASGINLKKLAETGVEIFFTQVFRDNFFHADMHPGNIMVEDASPENPRYLGVDFGIVGTLAVADQYYLAANFLAFFNHDYRRVAELHIRSGWVPKGTREDELESAVRTVCEPIFQQPLSRISFGLLLMRLLRVARQFNMEVQPQLVLLQKTLLNIEGLGRQIYPELDLWDTAKPFLERWVAEYRSPRKLIKKLAKRLPEIIESIIDGEGLPTPVKERDEVAQNQTERLLRREVSILRWGLIVITMVVLAGVVALVLLA